MRVRILAIETTRHYHHQHPTGLAAARQQLDELEAIQQRRWAAHENEPPPGAIGNFANRKYPEIYASAGLRQLIAETCEARTLIARRRVAVLEAGLPLQQDDWIRLVVDTISNKRGVMLTAFFRDALQRKLGKDIDGQECLVPYRGELSRAVMSNIRVLREWKARRAADGDPFVQPKPGQASWVSSNDPKPPSPPPTLSQLRAKRLQEDFIAFLERERTIRDLGADQPSHPPRFTEMLEQCNETLLLAEDARKLLRAAGDLSEPVPTHFGWALGADADRYVWFIVQFNGPEGPVVKMHVEHRDIPARAWIAPEKAVREWEAFRIRRSFAAPPEPSIAQDLAALNLDNVTPRMAVDILQRLQARAYAEIARKQSPV